LAGAAAAEGVKGGAKAGVKTGALSRRLMLPSSRRLSTAELVKPASSAFLRLAKDTGFRLAPE